MYSRYHACLPAVAAQGPLSLAARHRAAEPVTTTRRGRAAYDQAPPMVSWDAPTVPLERPKTPLAELAQPQKLFLPASDDSIAPSNYGR